MNKGKKRPEQAIVMRNLWKEGKIVAPPKKPRICSWCNSTFYWEDSENHRKTCSDDCAKLITKNQWKRYPHPKGMKGKHQTEEFKKNMSERSKEMWKEYEEKLGED